MTNRRTPTRERILDAALKLFMERGIGGTTVMEIERESGLAVGSGSFYRHFRSKEELVVPALQRGIAAARDQIRAERQVLEEVDDAHDRRSADYQTLLRDMRHIHPLWLLVLSERDAYPELQEVFLDSLGMREWELRWDEDRVRTVAIAALTGFHSLSLLDTAYFATIDPEAFVATLVEITELADAMLPSSVPG